jgi:hypothetical protein
MDLFFKNLIEYFQFKLFMEMAYDNRQICLFQMRSHCFLNDVMIEMSNFTFGYPMF